MELGEYFLHVFVEDTISLYSESGDHTNPVITVVAMGKTQSSHPKKDISTLTSTFWGDHFYFNKRYDNRDVLEDEILEIKVFDHSKVLRNSLIGQIEINLSSIYFEQDHTVRNKWYILQNKKKNYQQVMGYLKVSINLAALGEKRASLEPNTSSNEGSLSSLSIPPEIRLEQKELKVSLFMGRSFARVDGGKTCDPYVKILYGDQYIKTEHKANSLAPEYYLNVFMPIAEPSFIKNVVVEVKDKNTLFGDDALGSVRLKLHFIKMLKYQEPFWAHIYGSPIESKASGDFKEDVIKMNTYSKSGKRGCK